MRRRRTDGVATALPVALTAAVDHSRRFSEGGVIQTSVRARLLGLPLLRLNATIVVIPAAITASAAVGTGEDLAEAVRSITDGAEILAEVRSNGRR